MISEPSHRIPNSNGIPPLAQGWNAREPGAAFLPWEIRVQKINPSPPTAEERGWGEEAVTVHNTDKLLDANRMFPAPDFVCHRQKADAGYFPCAGRRNWECPPDPMPGSPAPLRWSWGQPAPCAHRQSARAGAGTTGLGPDLAPSRVLLRRAKTTHVSV